MRIVIASRVYAPEVSAASWLLQSVAREFRDRGCDVTVVTTRLPRGMAAVDEPGIRVRRAPVIRDRQRYVRGYLSYLSFDLPLAFRLLFSRHADLYIVEPPPTTIAVAVAVGLLRRTPVALDAADLWSDAAVMVTRSRLVLRIVRAVELWGLRHATHLFAAHGSLLARLRELGISTPATPIGFGADTGTFRYDGEAVADNPVFVYAGTHSEWHGAGIFVEAFPAVLAEHPAARLLFIGNGADREVMGARAESLGIGHRVEFRAPISPASLAPILATATASLASVKPAQGYDYAFATKVYSSLAAGCPVVFAGIGPTVAFLLDDRHPHAGTTVEYDAAAVAVAMNSAAAAPHDPLTRGRLAEWTAATYSLHTVAALVADTSLAILNA